VKITNIPTKSAAWTNQLVIYKSSTLHITVITHRISETNCTHRIFLLGKRKCGHGKTETQTATNTCMHV